MTDGVRGPRNADVAPAAGWTADARGEMRSERRGDGPASHRREDSHNAIRPRFRRASLLGLALPVDFERPEGLEPRVDRDFVVLVGAASELAAAFGTQSGTILATEGGDRLC